ncbi:hypothetical protein [uncultured Maritalea sp.]|jgi:uncharacterized membrane protein|uniref:DUF1254 domain-containing protein n=1 Tax=uncultured Maritalea sp. TaxID=757249 RepID=UPI002634F53D|nr:hypothetical protein [uncultured Maritalea sp.]
MIRFFTHLFAGIVLGGIIHISVILIMPLMSTHNAWTTISRFAQPEGISVIDSQSLALRAQLDLDPAFSYAVCQVDLSNGPIELSGAMPAYFWTAALIGQDGTVPYSTNSRTNNNRDLKIGIFTEDQSRALISEGTDIDPALQIVRVQTEQITAIIRIIPPHLALVPTMEEQISALKCSSL